MAIVFLCPTGTYASLVAANLKVGKIDVNFKLSEILNLPYFGEFSKEPGHFLFIGRDFKGNEVYTLGTGIEAHLITRSASDLLQIMNISPDNLKLYDTTRFIPRVLWRLNHYSYLLPSSYKLLMAYRLNSRLAEMDKWLKNIF